MSDATNEAVLKLYDHLAAALGLIRDQEVRIQALEDQAARHQRLIDANGGLWAQTNDEVGELRDFVHGMNDRHADLKLGVDWWIQKENVRKAWEGATAPVAEVSE